MKRYKLNGASQKAKFFHKDEYKTINEGEYIYKFNKQFFWKYALKSIFNIIFGYELFFSGEDVVLIHQSILDRYYVEVPLAKEEIIQTMKLRKKLRNWENSKRNNEGEYDE